MPDYIYLLENRLSPDQRNALGLLREAAREAEMILFLTGDAVRDLTSGHAVRDLEVAVHGNALKLKKIIEKAGGKVWGEDAPSQSLYLCFPGTVRVDVVSTHSVEYKKPGQPTYHFASIQEDLRRRDFTVNAMAISLNEGSFGLLMDPLNGVADIEARALRLVSNYGFIENPGTMIRATRLRARLGWEMDPKTQTRYENAKAEETIQYLSELERRRELEQIGHEDDALRIMQALEAEGWMKVLDPHWTSAKADEGRLKALHDLVVELLMQGVHADTSAAQMQLLTSKMPPKDLAALKKEMLRPGFVEEWNSLDSLAAGFAKVLLAKENQTPSASFKLFTSYDPEAVLWLGFTSKDPAVKERYHNFLKVWPEVRQKIPYTLLQEMRIRPELANYNEILHVIFLELIDGKLTTPEEMKAFLEPYSPPAPPPQITIKRTRGRRAEAKVKDFEEEEEAEESGDEDLDDMGGGDDDDIGLGMPKVDIPLDVDEGADEEEEEEGGEDEESEDEEEEPAPKRGKAAKGAAAVEAKPAKAAAPAKPAPVPEKHGPAKGAAPAKAPAKAPAAPVKAAPTKAVAAPAKHAPVKAPIGKGKPAPVAKTAAPAKSAVKKAALKPHTKPAHKSVPKAPAKPVAKAAPKPAAKPKPHKAAKPAPKKAAKPVKKR
ncbi:CCA tRNA nucleotidyltransferase [Acidobacteria bacterium AB60]|nr:CCA tRNA nucleotidyltransferase [Acidobacteria bacterium AB60]